MTDRLKKVKWLYLLGFIFISQFAGIIGSFFTIQSVDSWYETLIKPFFSPPDWLFSPVWISLYTLMGIAAYIIFRSEDKTKKYALLVFLLHLVINSLWSFVFFGLQSLLGGLVVIIILLFLIVYLIKLFGDINENASFLLYPYVMWVCFATLLNLALLLLN